MQGNSTIFNKSDHIPTPTKTSNLKQCERGKDNTHQPPFLKYTSTIGCHFNMNETCDNLPLPASGRAENRIQINKFVTSSSSFISSTSFPSNELLTSPNENEFTTDDSPEDLGLFPFDFSKYKASLRKSSDDEDVGKESIRANCYRKVSNNKKSEYGLNFIY